MSEMGYPHFQIGNKVTTVPKDSSTNRVIAIEPGLNLFFQASVGNMIKRRLQRYGVDLRYQSRNQQLARIGSITNSLATVDLSSASDSISTEVVRELLPPRWFSVMDASRSHYGLRNDSFQKWEKFSSMGNGFTFQLESLIFYAVASCCSEYHHLGSTQVSAYGDDVILPSACFGTLSEMLAFYGFQINEKKSHYNSPFRESCGSHYFAGVDIKPIYLKDSLSSLQSVYRLANAIRRLSHRRGANLCCDKALYRTHHMLVQSVPKALRLMIPENLGDGGFISSFDEAVPTRARFGIEGYRVKHLMEVSKTYSDDRVGYLLAELWRVYKRSRTDFLLDTVPTYPGETISGVSARTTLEAINAPYYDFDRKARSNRVDLNGRLRIKVVNSVVQQWSNLGPWL